MANWVVRAAQKKDKSLCDDLGVHDITMFCALACFIPWAKFISFAGGNADDPCCISDTKNSLLNPDGGSVSSTRSMTPMKKYKVDESSTLANHIVPNPKSFSKQSSCEVGPSSSPSSNLWRQRKTSASRTMTEPASIGPQNHPLKDL